MQITGANDVDIMLDEDGQPVSDGNGDTALVSDDECWLQDIKNEAMTEEGELFYEDEEGDTGTASSKCLVQRLITTGRQTSCNRLMTWFLNRTRSSWQETSM